MATSETPNCWAIKFGGSSVTHKGELHSFNHENIDWLVEQVGILYRKNIKFIIIHGAGCFGHFEWSQVKSLKQDFINNLERIKIKVVETRFYVKTLNMEIVKKLLENGVPALTVSPMEFGDLHSNEFKEKIQKLLSDGYVPVMHGDLNFNVNEEFPFSITSGDTILDVLSEKNISSSSVFISDVYGAFLSCPSDESKSCELIAMNNGLIKTIQIRENGEKTMELYNTEKNGSEITTQVVHSHDVTGGFEKKLSCAFDIAKRNQDVFILKASTPHLLNVLEGKEFVGTTITKL